MSISWIQQWHNILNMYARYICPLYVICHKKKEYTSTLKILLCHYFEYMLMLSFWTASRLDSDRIVRDLLKTFKQIRLLSFSAMQIFNTLICFSQIYVDCNCDSNYLIYTPTITSQGLYDKNDKYVITKRR